MNGKASGKAVQQSMRASSIVASAAPVGLHSGEQGRGEEGAHRLVLLASGSASACLPSEL